MNELIRLAKLFNEMETKRGRGAVREALILYLTENNIKADFQFRSDKITRVIYHGMGATVIIDID